MIILDVNKIGMNYGYGQLFEDISFSLNEGETISIVGPNGCGKSTLLKIIAGIEKADNGQISIKKDAKVAYLDQIGSSTIDDRIVYDILKDTYKDLNEIEKKIKSLQEKLNSDIKGEEYNKVLNKYCNLLDRFSELGGYDMDININAVIDGLNINKEILNQKYNLLSGGEKTLVQLAKVLIIKPDLVLLDEPTNHLDISRIEWLESYIESFKGAAVIVSHDRYFLDKMSNKILDIDNGVGKIYNTNYTGYIEEKQKDFEKQMANYKDQQAIIKRLEEQRKYFAQRGMATNSSTLCDRAHVLQAKIERLKKAAISRPQVKKKLNIDFNEIRKSSKKVISVDKLSVTTPENRIILNKINLDIYSHERVAFIGKNGSGKTTFIKTVLGEQDLEVSGNVQIGPSVKIGYLPQVIQFDNEDQQLLEYFKNSSKTNEQRAREILAKFEFYKEDVNKRVKNLSGGERMKVKLADLLQKKINTLIFDEPTNHIDIPTKEVLEGALEEFDGTLIFISHDRYFINKFADKVIEFEDGKINIYLGNYDNYIENKK